jgi:inhibitor of cysteine peptidase
MTAKKGTAWAIAGLLVAGIVVALLLGWRPWGADGVHELDAGDDGTVVEVEVGEEVVVSLEGNATTGYSWQVTAVDSAVLALKGDPDYESSSNADGAGGTYTFHFDALAAGETEVVLQYFPTWEQPSATAGSFTFTVVVG